MLAVLAASCSRPSAGRATPTREARVSWPPQTTARQIGALQTQSGLLVVVNDAPAHFSLAFSGKKVRAHVAGRANTLQVDGVLFLVDTFPFYPPTTNVPTVLDAFLKREQKHYRQLGVSVEGRLHAENGKRWLLYMKMVPREGFSNLGVATLVANKVVVVTAPIENDDGDHLRQQLTEAVSSLTTSIEPIDINAEARRLGAHQAPE